MEEELAALQGYDYVVPCTVEEAIQEGLGLAHKVAVDHLFGHFEKNCGAVEDADVGGVNVNASIVVTEAGDQLKAMGASRELHYP